MANLLELISLLRKQHNISVRRDWLQQKLIDIGRESTKVLVDRIYKLFLDTDIKLCAEPSLPNGVNQKHNEVIQSAVVQFDEFVDISEPIEKRYHIDSPNRTLKISITDGYQRVYAIEKARIPGISMKTPAGVKVRLMNVQIRRGLLLLEPANVEILGGKVDELVQIQQQNRQKAQRALIPEEWLNELGEVPPDAEAAVIFKGEVDEQNEYVVEESIPQSPPTIPAQGRLTDHSASFTRPKVELPSPPSESWTMRPNAQRHIVEINEEKKSDDYMSDKPHKSPMNTNHADYDYNDIDDLDALLEAEASATTPIAQGTSSTTQPPYKSDPVIDLTEDDFPISDDDFMVFADAEQEVLNEEPRPSSPENAQPPFTNLEHIEVGKHHTVRVNAAIVGIKKPFEIIESDSGSGFKVVIDDGSVAVEAVIAKEIVFSALGISETEFQKAKNDLMLYAKLMKQVGNLLQGVDTAMVLQVTNEVLFIRDISWPREQVIADGWQLARYLQQEL